MLVRKRKDKKLGQHFKTIVAIENSDINNGLLTIPDGVEKLSSGLFKIVPR